MYPNPAEDIVHFYVNPISDQLSLLVYDIFGRKMREFEFSEKQNQMEIDVSGFASGVYVTILYSRNRIIDRRPFVVK